MEEENTGTSNMQVGMVSYFLKVVSLKWDPFKELCAGEPPGVPQEPEMKPQQAPAPIEWLLGYFVALSFVFCDDASLW